MHKKYAYIFTIIVLFSTLNKAQGDAVNQIAGGVDTVATATSTAVTKLQTGITDAEKAVGLDNVIGKKLVGGAIGNVLGVAGDIGKIASSVTAYAHLLAITHGHQQAVVAGIEIGHIVANFIPAGNGLFNFISALAQHKSFGTAVNGFIDGVGSNIEKIPFVGPAIKAGLTLATQKITQGVNTAVHVVGNAFQTFGSDTQHAFQSFGNDVSNAAHTVGSALAHFFHCCHW